MSASDTVGDERAGPDEGGAPNDVVLTDGNAGTVARNAANNKDDSDGTALNDENAMNPE